MRGGGRVAGGVSANEYSCAHGTQINFGDLTPYLTYDFGVSIKLQFPGEKIEKAKTLAACTVSLVGRLDKNKSFP